MPLKKKKIKDRSKEDTREVEKAQKRSDERRKVRLEDEDKRRTAKTKGDPTLQGTTGEGGSFRVLGSFHKEGPLEPNPGMIHEKDEEFESPLPLDELFANKFLRLSGGKTRLGRDEDRKQIDSEVRDKPLPQRVEEAEEDAEAGADEEDEAAEETTAAKKAKTADRRRAAEAMGDEERTANPTAEEDEDDEPVKFADRKKKAEKKAKNRSARKHRE
jgi:hypothetical protein